MKQDEFINALHNTIDLNKKLICEALKNGSEEVKLWFTIEPGRPVSFNVEVDKSATLEFNRFVPFTMNDFEITGGNNGNSK